VAEVRKGKAPILVFTAWTLQRMKYRVWLLLAVSNEGCFLIIVDQRARLSAFVYRLYGFVLIANIGQAFVCGLVENRERNLMQTACMEGFLGRFSLSSLLWRLS